MLFALVQACLGFCPWLEVRQANCLLPAYATAQAVLQADSQANSVHSYLVSALHAFNGDNMTHISISKKLEFSFCFNVSKNVQRKDKY